MPANVDKSKINQIIVLYIELFLHNELSFIHSLTNGEIWETSIL